MLLVLNLFSNSLNTIIPPKSKNAVIRSKQDANISLFKWIFNKIFNKIYEFLLLFLLSLFHTGNIFLNSSLAENLLGIFLKDDIVNFVFLPFLIIS